MHICVYLFTLMHIDECAYIHVYNFKPVFNKGYRNINTHSDAVPELHPGTVAGSALCAFRYILV